MRIEHVTKSIDSTHGGIARSVSQLVSVFINQAEINITLLCLESSFPLLRSLKKDKSVITFCKPNLLGYSTQLNSLLEESKSELYHGHGLWQMPVHQMAKIARKKQVPYIIAPRGMLEAWSLKQNKFKKKIGLKLFQFKDLRDAKCFHATAVMEAQSIRSLGFKNPIAVIPNGVPLEEFHIKHFNGPPASKKVLFLSRIHHKKGIELLIEAWSELSPSLTKEWSLDIVGNGEAQYINRLNALISMKGISDSIKIKGYIDGAEKISAYQNAQLLVLPSYSENFGIVVAEALACGTPVITTKDTPWQDLETYKCGWWIKTGVGPLKTALEEALTLPQERLDVMGKNGRQLIEDKYSMDIVAKKITKLYLWLLKKGEKPDFVMD